jgi:hypothetical protein
MSNVTQIQIRDAKAQLSEVVDRAAVVVGYEEWQRLSKVPSFGWLLMNSPLEEGDIPERDQSPPRDPGF